MVDYNQRIIRITDLINEEGKKDNARFKILKKDKKDEPREVYKKDSR